MWDADNGANVDSGPFRQVSRLGNPLVNEVLIPLGKKDQWNSQPPSDDELFADTSPSRSWRRCFPSFTPASFPTSRAGHRQSRAPTWRRSCSPASPRASSAGFQNFTGPVQADMLRLNTVDPASRPTSRTFSACSAATRPASRTAGG